MSDEQNDDKKVGPLGADTLSVIYILGGIPAIVAFVVILFALTSLFPETIPA